MLSGPDPKKGNDPFPTTTPWKINMEHMEPDTTPVEKEYINLQGRIWGLSRS